MVNLFRSNFKLAKRDAPLRAFDSERTDMILPSLPMPSEHAVARRTRTRSSLATSRTRTRPSRAAAAAAGPTHRSLSPHSPRSLSHLPQPRTETLVPYGLQLSPQITNEPCHPELVGDVWEHILAVCVLLVKFRLLANRVSRERDRRPEPAAVSSRRPRRRLGPP